eukprot:1565886-Ditylum_brightwellii.AAC.1
MDLDVKAGFSHNINLICPRKRQAINLDVMSQETTQPAIQQKVPAPSNAITQDQLTQQTKSFRDEMAEASERLFQEQEK